MTLETFEGPWEEIQAHIPEFVGHQVRVTVLDRVADKSQETSEPMTLAEKLQGKIGTIEGASPTLSENTSDAFARILSDDHQAS